MGSTFQFSNYTCIQCGRAASYISRHGYDVVLIYNDVTHGEIACKYANTILVVTARAHEAECKAIQEAIEKAAFNTVVKNFGLDPEAGIACQWIKGQFEVINAKGDILPVDGDAFHTAACKMMPERSWPGKLVPPPIPPRVPEGVTCYLRNSSGEYEKVDPAMSARAFVPKDPRRTAHDKYWARIFQLVRRALALQNYPELARSVKLLSGTTSKAMCYVPGKTPVPDFVPTEIPNQYYEDATNAEPWYTFEVNRTKFEVGPRKRVNSISFDAGMSYKTVASLRDLAKQDGVTYEADGVLDTSQDKATKMLIHAWGEEKTVEYLVLAIKAALG